MVVFGLETERLMDHKIEKLQSELKPINFVK